MTDPSAGEGGASGTGDGEGPSRDGERYVCVHGHFYQPPRENPWLEAVEIQRSARPYHDWNERVTAEAYAPNAASRVLDGEGRIRDVMNNYARISFNVGPTLLAWLEEHRRRVYRAILEADRESRERFGGHGSALAQVYNHMILPLADRREKETQVRWGVRDFEDRFGREPEGMWLPETAVDLESLDVLAEHGIRFTILDPRQARRFRPLGDPDWTEADPGGEDGDRRRALDPRRAYLQRLPSGREIALFFYDAPLARAVAFEELLEDGDRFAERLLSGFRADADHPQLAHIATDGETYGHHHRHGEMALSRALLRVEDRDDVQLTNYAQFLDRHPPALEVEIREESSWSCVHGVERWRSDCGCSTGGEPGWDQSWRAPLRSALDHLRDAVRPALDRAAGDTFRDFREARSEYLDVIRDRRTESVDRFLARHLAGEGRDDAPERKVRALRLLETERHLQLMYTSCGWFFHDLAGIETVQVLRYAGRALQLARSLFDVDLEEPFLDRLADARSNRPEEGSGREIFRRSVEPLVLDLADVACHHALMELLLPAEGQGSYYCYHVTAGDRSVRTPGEDGPAAGGSGDPAGRERGRLLTGRTRVESRITRARAEFRVAAVDLGDLHLLARAAAPADTSPGAGALHEELSDALQALDAHRVVEVLDRRIPGPTRTFRSLALEEQVAILHRKLGDRVDAWEGETRDAYLDAAGPARLAGSLDVALPPGTRTLLEAGLEASLRREIARDPLDAERVERLLDDAHRLDLTADAGRLKRGLRARAEALSRRFREDPFDLPSLRQLDDLLRLLERMPGDVERWTLQNDFVHVARDVLPAVAAGETGPPEPEREEWETRLRRVGAALSISPELYELG